MIEEFAPAKINLDLRVHGRRHDGYHDLSSCVVFADVGDRLSLARADQFSLALSGPEAGGLACDASNLALRAALALVQAFPQEVGPVAVHLEKNLPVASGIGGGSADAAAVLRGMQRVFGVCLPGGPLRALALTLGADVPVCLGGVACQIAGVGETIVPQPDWPAWHALLLNPRVQLSTAAVFGALSLARGQTAHAAFESARHPAMPRWINDLEAPARRLVPEINMVLDTLRALEGCDSVLMSGSGATCVGLFATAAAAQAGQDTLATLHPDWWARAATLNGRN